MSQKLMTSFEGIAAGWLIGSVVAFALRPKLLTFQHPFERAIY
jgi:hypothetical protein